ncbi:MAG: hypothetical protein WD266_04415 [Balneolales bacterium]
MGKMQLLGLALIILLVPFFLISYGTTGDSPTLWWIGLILLGIGGLIPPITRYVFTDNGG